MVRIKISFLMRSKKKVNVWKNEWYGLVFPIISYFIQSLKGTNRGSLGCINGEEEGTEALFKYSFHQLGGRGIKFFLARLHKAETKNKKLSIKFLSNASTKCFLLFSFKSIWNVGFNQRLTFILRKEHRVRCKC